MALKGWETTGRSLQTLVEILDQSELRLALLQERHRALAVVGTEIDVAAQAVQIFERGRVDRHRFAQHPDRFLRRRDRGYRPRREGPGHIIDDPLEVSGRHDPIDD